MFRFKTLSVLAGLVAVLAISATPASAWWKSTQTQGTVKVIEPGAFTDGTAIITCPKEEVKVQWSIQAAAQIKAAQTRVTEGPHLSMQVKWGNKEYDCLTKIAGSETETNVTACELQLAQAKTSLIATGGVVTPCTIKIGKGSALCELLVPTGMEKSANSNEGINVGLTETTLSNVGANQLDKVNTEKGGAGQLGTGVRVNQIPGHTNCAVATNEKGALTGLEIEAENVKAI